MSVLCKSDGVFTYRAKLFKNMQNTQTPGSNSISKALPKAHTRFCRRQHEPSTSKVQVTIHLSPSIYGTPLLLLKALDLLIFSIFLNRLTQRCTESLLPSFLGKDNSLFHQIIIKYQNNKPSSQNIHV